MTLESGHSLTERSTADALPLFAHVESEKKQEESTQNHEFAKRIANINANTLTPIEALTLLEELSKEARKYS
jgi:hypothetical protein